MESQCERFVIAKNNEGAHVCGCADLIGFAFSAVAVMLFAACSGFVSNFLINQDDVQLIAAAYSAPGWVEGLGWLGQVSICLSFCYLGAELGYSLVGCLFRRGLVNELERPATMTALQWVSAIGFSAAFLAHLCIFLACELGVNQYPVQIGLASSDLLEMTAFCLPAFGLFLLVPCLLLRLGPNGRFLRLRRRVNKALKPHAVARWLYMCASMFASPFITVVAAMLASIIVTLVTVLVQLVVVLLGILFVLYIVAPVYHVVVHIK